MKTFKHKIINEKVCDKFDLKTYKRGNFTFFYREENLSKVEVGYIEKISNPNYLYTFLISFFDFENEKKNDKIVNFVKDLYIEQKKEIDKNKRGVNNCLELRGDNICKSILI